MSGDGDGHSIPKIAAELSAKLTIAKSSGILFSFDGSRYVPGEEALRMKLADMLGNDWSRSRVESVLVYLKDTAMSLWETPPLGMVNVANGLLNLNSMALQSHSPEFLSATQIPARWQEQAESPGIDNFIREVFDADNVQLAYELAGLLCFPDNSLQKAIMLVGDGSNGKSVYLNLLTHLIGRDNVSHLSLHDLASNRFAPASLIGKLANICADIPSSKLMNTSMFKAITGGDRLMAERKYENLRPFQPYSRLIFSANEFPDSPDAGYGFLRRWIVIRFNQRFEGFKADRRLLEKLTTPEELAGFLLKSILAYSAMISEGRSLTVGDSSLAALEEFRDAIDPVGVFARERVVIDPTSKVLQRELYMEWKAWEKYQGVSAYSARRFNSLFAKACPEATVARSNGKSWWFGIRQIPNDPVGFIPVENAN